MLSHAIKVKQNLHSKNAFSWRYTLFLLITIRFKTILINISTYNTQVSDTKKDGSATSTAEPVPSLSNIIPQGRGWCKRRSEGFARQDAGAAVDSAADLCCYATHPPLAATLHLTTPNAFVLAQFIAPRTFKLS